jgi:hypothetical protein
MPLTPCLSTCYDAVTYNHTVYTIGKCAYYLYRRLLRVTMNVVEVVLLYFIFTQRCST